MHISNNLYDFHDAKDEESSPTKKMNIKKVNVNELIVSTIIVLYKFIYLMFLELVFFINNINDIKKVLNLYEKQKLKRIEKTKQENYYIPDRG